MMLGWRNFGTKILAALFVCFVGCGGSGSTQANLSSSGEGGGGTGITNTFSSPSQMGVGDIMSVEFSATSSSIDFSSVTAGSNFILAVGSSNTSGGGVSMQLSSSVSLPDNNSWGKAFDTDAEIEGGSDGYSAHEIMDSWLRASESILASTEESLDSKKSFSLTKSMTIKDAAVGQTETFRVLSSLTSTSSYVEVTGKVRCVGSNVVFYVDTAVSSTNLSDADVNTLCADFETAADQEFDIFGSMSDVDSDGKLHILMTKQVNKLGALGGGIITGYFYAGDLYSRSSSNPVSNHREIIYTMVPDPTGQYGTTISNSFAMSNLLPAVLPHELQHAISYNQHVFVNGGSSEENWLNEGMSHLAEDILGYGNENPSRYEMFMASPSTYGLVTQGSPNLMERGAAFLFLRFLYEQAASGSAFLAALENSSLRGVDNLETAFNGQEDFDQFSEFMARWVTALVMTNRGISYDARYTYKARVKNATTGNWEGVCLICDPEDNRGTALEGVNLNSYYGSHTPTVDAGAAIYYDVSTIPDNIQLAGEDGGGNFGILIRTQ